MSFFQEFKAKWHANDARLRRYREALAVGVPSAEEDAEAAWLRAERYGLLHQLAIRLSKESISGAGRRDLQILELIDCAKVVAKCEAIAIDATGPFGGEHEF